MKYSISSYEILRVENKDRHKNTIQSFQKGLKPREVRIYDELEESLDILLKDGDSINVLRVQSKIKLMFFCLENSLPGYYDISAGQTISEVLIKPADLLVAYPEGAVFTRESVKEQLKESFEKNAQNLERSLVDAVSSEPN